VKLLRLVYELPMLSEFFKSRVRIQALRDGPAEQYRLATAVAFRNL